MTPRGRTASAGPEAAGRLAAADSVDELERDLQAVTSELVNVQDQLLAIYDLAGALRGHLEPEALLTALVGEAIELVGAAGGFVTLGGGEPVPAVVSPELRLQLADARRLVALCRGVTDVVVHSVPSVGKVMLTAIALHDRASAFLGLVRSPGASFSAPEQKLMSAIAAYGGAQLEGVLLHQQTLHQARLDREFELARHIQTALAPDIPTSHPGLDVYAESRAAYVVGGDFFDFVHGGDGRLTCVLGDVAGKGIPAALLVAMSRALIRAATRGVADRAPGAALARANAELHDSFSRLDRFATVFMASFDPVSRRLVVANAGHSPVVYRPASGHARLLAADAVPLGVLRDMEATDHELQLGPGDLLVAATDGFSEAAETRTGELFGYDRVLELIDRTAGLDAAAIAALLFRATDSFSSGDGADDDRTLVVLRGIS